MPPSPTLSLPSSIRSHSSGMQLLRVPPLAGGSFFAQTQQIAEALPPPETLPEGTLVVVLGETSQADGLVARMLQSLRGRSEAIPRAPRASALLARGYVRIGAARDETSAQDLVWGFTS